MKYRPTTMQTLVKSTIIIKEFLDKTPKLTGWTADEFENLKKLLKKGISSNLQMANNYVDFNPKYRT